MDPQIVLTTPRLILRLPSESDRALLNAFENRNMRHLSPWRSATGEIDVIGTWKQEFEDNRSVRFLLFLKENPEGEIIGFCNFTQIFRGCFHACYLGYHIDGAYEGKGLMSEAVKRAIHYMFETQNIHRIMANYMPSNARSGKLLHNLGFTIEGRADKYLFINGQWEDHILTSLTNEKWVTTPKIDPLI